MKQGKFITAISEVYRIPYGTVRLFVRELNKAGLLTSGAHGVNAPDMTPLDAARLTIAILGTDKPTQASQAVETFGNLGVNRFCNQGDVPPFALNEEYCFVLEEILELFFGLQLAELTGLTSLEISREGQEATMVFGHWFLKKQGGKSGSVVFDVGYETVEEALAREETKGKHTIARLKYMDMEEIAWALNGVRSERNSKK
ncbi:hypothetical protein [Phaeobacter inhibens]|uniref:hypothetical protein n=1 Tax=Phaeobacter inhibens TaxID=221822 RepID=UPI0021A8A458|nr:hypothetical protein [Phaeobacter inhibens]UWR75351.1 hypothetical protein K4L04_12955 [Phaeobacter inhibens]UWR99226.1 hypothetical protein K4L03_12525 [Phaeobacter inhibens]UWS07088.1 hypothetical protein K4K98_12675 [Phaeobacter inhibens]